MNFFTSPLKYFDFFNFQRASYRYLSFIAQPKRKSSYSFRTGSIPLTNATVGDVLEQAASNAGDDVAFVSAYQGISKTYQEFRNEVVKLASGFIANGLQRGDKIALYSPNCYEWPLTQFAAAKAGLVLVNINPVTQAHELEYFLRKVGCKAIISFDRFKTQDGYKVLNRILPDLPTSNPRKLQSKILPNLENIFMLTKENKEGTISFHELLHAGTKDSQEALLKTEKSIDCDDPVFIQFTSGTTGTPKAAVLSHHNVINNALISGNKVGFHEMRHIICCQAPMFHSIGCVMAGLATVMYQNTCVFPSYISDPFECLQSIKKYKCTTAIGSPTMFIDILKAYRETNEDIDSLKHVLMGGAAESESLVSDLRNTFKLERLQVGYGLTETSPCILISRKEYGGQNKNLDYLVPVNFIEIRIVDKSGATVPINKPGEICCRGHAVFLGYLDKEETEKVIDKKRWFHTGDLGAMNEEGECKVIGRIKDMVNRGGENIYCREVENFMSSHPAVQEAAAVGVPDERLGEELCCWISVKPGMSLTEEEIRNFFKGKISHYKIPRYIMFTEDFPKTLSGKVKKLEMARISKQKLNL